MHPHSCTHIHELFFLHNAMLLINPLERQQLAGPTPKFSGGVGGTPKSKSAKVRNINLSTQALKVAHQRVSLNVDLAKKKVIGVTEITVVPMSSTLRVVRLDCREMKIRRVFINGRGLSNYLHNDLLYINDPQRFDHSINTNTVNLSDIYNPSFNINQHHLLRQKLNYILGGISPGQMTADRVDNTNTEELAIILPENLKLEPTDLHSLHTPSDAQASGMTPFHLRSRNTHSDAYTPIQIKVEYELCNPKNGLNFVCHSDDKNLWHAYTVNSEYNISTSSWVPCIDNLWERCTWSIDISIPRTVKDIVDLLAEEEQSLGRSASTQQPIEAEDGDDTGIDRIEDDNDSDSNDIDAGNNAKGDENDNEEEDEDSENYDLFVCTGDFNNLKEMAHRYDPRKKVVSWSIFSPVCAHHVGWAVGPFQSKELSDFNEAAVVIPEQDETQDEFEEIEKDESTSSVMLYFLPGLEDLVTNTCIFAHRALDFFLKEFGSFPFGSYGIVFVSGPAYPFNNYAGLSIISDTILYPPDVIEPMFTTTEDILECIASQWSTINIVPQVFNDLWCTIGIARFMCFQFIRSLMGSNEFRYQIKGKMDQIVEQDIGKSPLGMPTLKFPVSESDLTFVRLKAPIILFILDRRMTKTDKSFGLSRVLPKIFLQAMSGDLQNGTLSTQHFQYVCEKVNRNRLESFFKQWVYGVGTPVFNITQKFNKKRSMIEVTIRQTQLQQSKTVHPRAGTFIEDSIAFMNDVPVHPTQQTFLGPMTIRVHEADGTPYEHIVDIKDGVVKFDVQYNTKFKRLKKNKDENSEETPVFSKLGDVLQSEADMQKWNLAEWPKRDEEFLDPFEWIRVDTDFEWIAQFNVKQPDYMFGSQLQQDRDIEAQIAAIEYFGSQEKPTVVYCTMLLRTLMDGRYFYGVRIAAAKALGKISKSANNFAGISYLIRAFKELFCFENSLVPVSNSFDDFGKFFLQKSIPKFLGKVKDDDGHTPQNIKTLLFNLLKYNDNSNNEFQDCFYIRDLVSALTEAIIPTNTEHRAVDFHLEREAANATYSKEAKFVAKVVEEFARIQKLDRWVPSYQSMISLSCLEQMIRLARSNLIDFSLEDLLFFTFNKFSPEIRAMAFKGLFLLGGLKNSHIMKYFLEVYLLEESTMSFKSQLMEALVISIGEAAVNGTPSMLDDPEFRSLEKIIENGGAGSNQTTNMVVIEEAAQSSEMDTRRDVLARATIKGTIKLLRRDYSIGKGLELTMWELIHTSLVSLLDRRKIFTLCEILYSEVDSFPVVISVPCVPFDELKKKIVAKNLRDGKVIIKREGRFKIQLSAKISLNDGKNKISKKEPARPPLTRVAKASASNAEPVEPVEGILEEPPKLKLKLGQAPNNQISANVDTKRPEKITVQNIGNSAEEEKTTSTDSPVKRDGPNNMTVKFCFKKRRLNPLPPNDSVPKKLVTFEKSIIRIRFRDRGKLRDVKSNQASKGTRFIRISTRTGTVSLSATPYPEKPKEEIPKLVLNGNSPEALDSFHGVESHTETEVASENKRSKQPDNDENLIAKTDSPDEKLAPKVVGKVKREPPEADDVLSRSSSKNISRSTTEESRAASRAASPFSAEPSPATKKKKKTKIYIHDRTSDTPSPPPSGDNSSVKKEDSTTQSKPKLKLKLNLT